MSLTFFVVLNLFSFVLAKNEQYMGYKVYDVRFDTEDQQNKFHLLKHDEIDYWRKPSFKYGVSGRAMVPPSHLEWFEEKLQELDVEKRVYIEDVYEHWSQKEASARTKRNDTDEVFDFDGYYRYDQILQYLRAVEEIHANSSISVDLIEFGLTAEERQLIYLRISKDSEDIAKPVIIIEAGINPREWITVPAALNIVNRLMDEDHERFLEKYEWIIIPVLNPDGYEFTHTTDRLWMKSSSIKSNLGFICPGVNINRNFDIDWLNFESSSSPCSHLYGGIEPFSEIESQLIKYLVEEYGSRISLYISLQNKGGIISYPWLYERAASGMFRQHHLLGLEMIEAMERKYELDVGSVVFDRISGTSADYVRESGILYTYNIDIVQGEGFHVPEEEIVDVIEDVWRAVSVAADRLN